MLSGCDYAKRLKEVAWMDVSETITWIAFRQPMKINDWSPLEISRSTRRWGGQPADGMLEALECRAAGKAWRPSRGKAPFFGAWPVRALVRQLMRETNLGAAELASELRVDRKRWAERDKAVELAAKQLQDAARSGGLEVWGRETTQSHFYGQAVGSKIIAPVEFAERLVIRIGSQAVFRDQQGDERPAFEDLKVKACRVLAIWGESDEGLVASISLDVGGTPLAENHKPTAGRERDLEKWLVQRMKAAPNDPPGKAAVRRAASGGGLIFSQRGFDRAYANAVSAADTPAWSSPGRKSKRRIDTPNKS